jgi:carbonic anhydrase
VSKPGGLAVLGALYQTAKFNETELKAVQNENYYYVPSSSNPILKYLVDIKDSGNSVFVTGGMPLNLHAVLKNLSPIVYSYKGSLTTPTCNEAVSIFEMEKKLTYR